MFSLPVVDHGVFGLAFARTVYALPRLVKLLPSVLYCNWNDLGPVLLLDLIERNGDILQAHG